MFYLSNLLFKLCGRWIFVQSLMLWNLSWRHLRIFIRNTPTMHCMPVAVHWVLWRPELLILQLPICSQRISVRFKLRPKKLCQFPKPMLSLSSKVQNLQHNRLHRMLKQFIILIWSKLRIELRPFVQKRPVNGLRRLPKSMRDLYSKQHIMRQLYWRVLAYGIWEQMLQSLPTKLFLRKQLLQIVHVAQSILPRMLFWQQHFCMLIVFGK